MAKGRGEIVQIWSKNEPPTPLTTRSTMMAFIFCAERQINAPAEKTKVPVFIMNRGVGEVGELADKGHAAGLCHVIAQSDEWQELDMSERRI